MIKRILYQLSRPIMCDKVIIVAGTTGVGKSQLSIQLAKKFNGEVINSDSMQMYKNIPVITNKHPMDEREGVPHHVMNHVDWSEEYYLHRFEEECIRSIEDIHKRNKVAIVVGGTHYYLQALFKKSVTDEERALTEEENKILNSEDPDLIYNTLVKYDPEIADKYHRNDTRRVKRMLEIYYVTGKKPSATFKDQEVSLRYPTLFLWLYSNPDELAKRLDDRVDKMLASSGMEEIQELFKYYTENNLSSETCENGVWQVIGFKEFLPWLLKQPDAVLDECIERMKIRTRQYAKKQVKWIKKMLIPDINGDIYILDATDLTKWDSNVGLRSDCITSQFLNDVNINVDRAPDTLKTLLNEANTILPKNNDFTNYTCDVCKDQNNKSLVAIGKRNWDIHIKGRRHNSNLNRGKKKQEYENYKRLKEANKNE
ncbi:hypothetical protein TPHA_0G00650 [Tetrapisispora phaffii CBS 4417]|uniref:tRNA dimethylallyltransferase n=1 Tax=Tetrapisispora phaffii (strain ATCC 24235 / CBS 4417 / NBRC 1672 / NRRL Y-8282 / UCD 70-5) TaxID=1071381 RepID=G8BVH3_TETPH|nr:hypothetical protein TPHA_0G00650 [Tetrapisispora phaffii CBS 4417]CCE63901.1 hypothetical protein TPHA_0G00650 [Tetrapisispora phaffii CBS 4417]